MDGPARHRAHVVERGQHAAGRRLAAQLDGHRRRVRRRREAAAQRAPHERRLRRGLELQLRRDVERRPQRHAHEGQGNVLGHELG